MTACTASATSVQTHTHTTRSLSPSPDRRTAASVDDARLLPRHREPHDLLESRRMHRDQSTALLESLASDPEAKLPLRHALTKPGDSQQLRGIPAIGRSVAGVSPGTDPYRETQLRIDRELELREKTAA